MFAILFLLFILFNEQGHEVAGGLFTQTSCTCLGYKATYECSVMGSRYTIWGGTAFVCASGTNEIILPHSRFVNEEGAGASCNNEAIEGRSLRVEQGTFTSQLVVTVSSEMIGKNISCTVDDGLSTTLVRRIILEPMRDPFPPPKRLSISFVDLVSRKVTLKWNNVDPNCPALHYNIFSSNCGSCPNTTSNTTVTCTDVPTNGSICTFALQTVVCGDIVGNRSDPIAVIFKGTSRSSSSSCDGTIVSASLFSIAFVVCISAIILFFLIKYQHEFKGRLSQLKRFIQRTMAIESTYGEERDVALTSRAAGAVTLAQPTYAVVHRDTVATSPAGAANLLKSNYSKNIAYLHPSKATDNNRCS